ncbi:MAG: STAS domain-containing protein [Methanobacteriota archaeon]
MKIDRPLQENDLAYSIREEMGDCMPIDIWYEGDIWVFRPSGRIDAGHSTDLDAALTEGIGQGMRLIVIDLTDVPYIASSGLRAFIRAAKSVKTDGGSVRVCGMHEHVIEVFRLSGLLKFFPNYPSSEEAIKDFQRTD